VVLIPNELGGFLSTTTLSRNLDALLRAWAHSGSEHTLRMVRVLSVRSSGSSAETIWDDRSTTLRRVAAVTASKRTTSTRTREPSRRSPSTMRS